MSDTGWIFPGTVIANGWSDANNIKSDDGNLASQYFDGKVEQSGALIGYNYGLSSLIPEGATINGIEFAVKRASASTMSVDSTISIGMTDTGTGTLTLAGDNKASAEKLPQTTPVEKIYGSSSDLWNSGYDREDIVNTLFGIETIFDDLGGVTCYVDYFKIKVYYTGSEPEASHRVFILGMN